MGLHNQAETMVAWLGRGWGMRGGDINYWPTCSDYGNLQGGEMCWTKGHHGGGAVYIVLIVSCADSLKNVQRL